MGRIHAISCILAAAIFAAPAFAATDGVLGATSTGTAAVSLVIPEQVRISDVNDIDLGVYDGSGPASGSTGLCVSGNGSGGYKVRVTGDSGVFRLATADQSASLPMNVSWNGTAALVSGESLTVIAPGAGCSGGNNASLGVSIGESHLQQAAPGAYSGTLTVMVEPG